MDEACGDASRQRLPEMPEMARAQHDQVSPFGHDQHAETSGRRRGRNDVTLGSHRQTRCAAAVAISAASLPLPSRLANGWKRQTPARISRALARGRETSSERDGRLGMTESVDTGENRPATATASPRRHPEPPSFDNGRPRGHGRVACHRSVAQPARRRIGGDRGSPLRDFYVAARLRRRGHAGGRSSVAATTSHAGAIRMCLQRMTSRLVGWIPQATAWRLWRGRRTRRI